VFGSSSAGHLADRRPGHVAVLYDPLTPGFFGGLTGSSQDWQTPLHAYRLSKWALNRMCRAGGRLGSQGARIVSMSP